MAPAGRDERAWVRGARAGSTSDLEALFRARRLRGEAELEEVHAADEPAEPLDGTVLAALAVLSPEHRAVVVLRHLLGYTPGEIADLLDLPRGTVNSRLRRGLDALGESLR